MLSHGVTMYTSARWGVSLFQSACNEGQAEFLQNCHPKVRCHKNKPGMILSKCARQIFRAPGCIDCPSELFHLLQMVVSALAAVLPAELQRLSACWYSEQPLPIGEALQPPRLFTRWPWCATASLRLYRPLQLPLQPESAQPDGK